MLLLFVAFGPQHSLFVCTTGECCTATVAVVDREPQAHCSCCRDVAAVAAKGRGPRVLPLCSHGCCVDLALLTEIGPLPTAVDCPDLTPHVVDARAPAGGAEHRDGGTERPPFHCTGPPRRDPRTALLATTILRL